MTNDPNDIVGRTFLDKGVWASVTFGVEKFLCKMTEEDYKRAISGQMFEVWHPLVPQKDAPLLYKAAAEGTLEPWYLPGAHCLVALMHPKASEHLDEVVKQSVSIIAQATQAQLNAQKNGTPKQALFRKL